MSDQNETRDRQPEGRRPAWQSGPPRGQERVVSYESDERYWTDYLRVALPVVGLLLMLGLLVWWANSIIGEEQGTQPTSTVATTPNVALAPSNTPTNTTEAGLTATQVPDPSTPGGDGGNGGDDATEDPDAGATEEPDECDGDYAPGDPVRVVDDNVSFRPNPDFEEAEPPRLAAGAELEISSDCYTEAEGNDGIVYRFWEVTVVTESGDVNSGDSGYVADAYFELVEE